MGIDRQEIAARLHACCIRARTAYAEAAALVEVLGATEPKDASPSIRDQVWESGGFGRGDDNPLNRLPAAEMRAQSEVEFASRYLMETIRYEANKGGEET